MRVDLPARRFSVVPGVPAPVVVTITNTSEIIAGCTVRVLGADPDWVEVDQPELSLFPDASAQVRLLLTLPVGVPAGPRRMAVQVRELTDEQAVAIEEIVVTVPDQPGLDVRLDPVTVTAGRRADFGVVVENNGNTVLEGRLRAEDPEQKISFSFTPPGYSLAPGETVTGRLRTRAKRPVFGSLAVRPFSLFVDDGVRRAPLSASTTAPVGAAPVAPGAPVVPGAAGQGVASPVPAAAAGTKTLAPPVVGAGTAPGADAPRPVAQGVFVQKPLFARGLLSLLGLLVAVTVFAVVIAVGLSSVLARSAADRDLALQVAQARFDSSAATGTAGVSGAVTLISDGQPVPGVAVEIFEASDTTAVVATAATSDTGEFAVDSLPAGDYKMRLRGAGFAEVWYPAGATDAEAEVVSLSSGQQVTGLSVLLGGVPATVSGTVLGDDAAGAVAELQIPLDSAVLAGLVDPLTGAAAPPALGDGAVVRTAPVGGDGTFSFAAVPSPAVYDLVVSKPGFSTQVHRIDVAAGEDRSDIEVSLLEGDGSISGLVTSASGPVPGATVVATYGQGVVQTVSLTQDEIGSFVLRGLQTPATFTVVVSAPGYASATLSVNLAEAQELTGLSVVLGQSAGNLSGQVTVPAGTSAAGVAVTVSDGAVTRQTVTRSSEPAGSWSIGGLPLPATYTVTFSRADLESQVVSVTVDGNGAVSTGPVDVTMRAATGRITGVVTQTATGSTASSPAANVQVTAASGSSTLSVTSASTPQDRGAFVLENVPPGTYTVTFSRKGTRPTSSIVTVVAGQTVELNPQLVSPASISGTVRAAGQPVAGLELRLFVAEEFGTAAPARAVVTSGADGTYLFPDVDAPAHYVIELRSATGTAALATSPALTIGQSDALTYDFSLDSLS